ncbi:MAG TPA: 2-amino-4-hydroxy-6-hydroxymethyldihydropteridine diphosphokinase [Terracidiphilus sp.]|nr:2-amino-4-hydroxy-6-hydroxymethyldihydropteridine diphosphokinase [Terracidiphilus sp.]
MRTAYIALGANLPSSAGEPIDTLAVAVERIGELGLLTARSSLYSTAPVGFAAQPRFLNAVVALQTTLPPHQLLEALRKIEIEFGRDRRLYIPNGPRSLDLDILLLNDVCVGEADLTIPHPRLPDRIFVLVPLYEIAARVVDPRSRRTIAELLSALHQTRDLDIDAVVRIESDQWAAGAVDASRAAGTN